MASVYLTVYEVFVSIFVLFRTGIEGVLISIKTAANAIDLSTKTVSSNQSMSHCLQSSENNLH